jgi:hypothetical protein
VNETLEGFVVAFLSGPDQRRLIRIDGRGPVHGRRGF